MSYNDDGIASKLVVREDNYNERIFIEEVLSALTHISNQLERILTRLNYRMK